MSTPGCVRSEKGRKKQPAEQQRRRCRAASGKPFRRASDWPAQMRYFVNAAAGAVGEEHHMKQRVQQVGKDSEQKRKQISHDGRYGQKELSIYLLSKFIRYNSVTMNSIRI